MLVGSTPLSAAPAYGVLLLDLLVWPKLRSCKWRRGALSSSRAEALDETGRRQAAAGGMPKQKSKVGFSSCNASSTSLKSALLGQQLSLVRVGQVCEGNVHF